MSRDVCQLGALASVSLLCREGAWGMCYSCDANAQAPSPASHFV